MSALIQRPVKNLNESSTHTEYTTINLPCTL